MKSLYAWLLASVFLTPDLYAVVVNPDQELSPPESGYVGRWRGSSAVAIGPHHFITAAHNGGNLNSLFQLRGDAYEVVSKCAHPSMDLRIFETLEPLPGWNELANHQVESGDLILMGGLGKIAGPSLPDDDGYHWGNQKREAWGANELSSVSPAYLGVRFDSPSIGVWSEASFAINDSGGGIFFPSANSLELVGIAISTTSTYGRSQYGDTGYGINLFNYTDWIESVVDGSAFVLAGDLNGDHIVNMADLTLALGNFDDSNPNPYEELANVLGNFGESFESPCQEGVPLD